MEKTANTLVILSLLGNITIAYYLYNETFLVSSYLLTRLFFTIMAIYDQLFLPYPPILKNKKFYATYWLKIWFFYKEYQIVQKFRNTLLHNRTELVSEKIPPNFYDDVVDGITELFVKKEVQKNTNNVTSTKGRKVKKNAGKGKEKGREEGRITSKIATKRSYSTCDRNPSISTRNPPNY